VSHEHVQRFPGTAHRDVPQAQCLIDRQAVRGQAHGDRVPPLFVHDGKHRLVAQQAFAKETRHGIGQRLLRVEELHDMSRAEPTGISCRRNNEHRLSAVALSMHHACRFHLPLQMSTQR
jgi:hypothetical protein